MENTLEIVWYKRKVLLRGSIRKFTMNAVFLNIIELSVLNINVNERATDHIKLMIPVMAPRRHKFDLTNGVIRE